MTTTVHDDKGNERRITVAQDEGIRPSTSMEALAKLKPAFKKNGSSTAGNSSQVSDGAAAILLARRSKAEELGLPILGVLRSYAVVGVSPDIMGIGPAIAIPVALQKAGEAAPSNPQSRSHFCLPRCRRRRVVLCGLQSKGGAD